MPVLPRSTHVDGCKNRRLGRDAPRGKAVEINALWINPLETMGRICPVARETKRGLRKTLGQSKEKFSEILERGAQLLLRRRRFTGHRK